MSFTSSTATVELFHLQRGHMIVVVDTEELIFVP